MREFILPIIAIAYCLFCGAMIYRIDQRHKENDRRLKNSWKDYEKTMRAFRRRQEMLDSLIEDGDDIVERVIN